MACSSRLQSLLEMKAVLAEFGSGTCSFAFLPSQKMSGLTEAQRQRMEENRRRALAKRAAAISRSLPMGNTQSGNVLAFCGSVYARGSNAGPSKQSETVSLKQDVKGHQSIDNQPRIPFAQSYEKPHTVVAVQNSTCTTPCSSVTSSSGVSQASWNNTSKQVGPCETRTSELSTTYKKSVSEAAAGIHKQASRQAITTATPGGGFKSGSSCQGKPFKATFVSLSNSRFYVDVGYHQKMIEIFKTIPSKMYDANTKRWNFSIRDHDNLVSKLQTLQPEVIFSPLPKHLVKFFSDISCSEKPDYDLSVLDPVLRSALLPFQKEGVNFGIRCDGKVLIADEMGLGKTIQAIAIANYYKKDWPLLVVTPSSVRYSWAEAFHTWLPSETAEVTVINSGKDYITKDKIILLSYDILTKKKDDILKRGFRSVIFDESHFLKNPKSARTKAAQQVMKNMSHIIMLSGTPALSRPVELFPQLSALNPKMFSNFMDFGIRYCSGKKMAWGWDFSGSSNMEELQILLESTVMIRRMKSDVIKQLPAKCRQIIILDPSLIASKNKALRDLSAQMSQLNLKGMEKRGVLLQYFHETGLVKIPAVCEYLRDLLEGGKKFICFAHHQAVLDGICEAVEMSAVDYIRIDGSTPSEQRKLLCDKFQTSERCKVAVLSITSANAGITLTAANLVVFAELFWNPGILTQAEDRAHRIGQEDSVVVQYLIAKGTADDEIWPLVQKKLDILNKAGLSNDNFSNSSTVNIENSTQPKIEDFWKEMESTITFEARVTDDDTLREDASSTKRAKVL